MAEPPRPVVAVVGGGVAGLAAAWELTGGVEGTRPSTPDVVVLDAADRLGGKLDTARFGEHPVDVGPDGFLGRRPEAAALCREVGLADSLEPIGASGAAVWARGRRRALPDGLLLGVPTRLLPVARSGILSPWGTLRLARDVLAPRPDVRGPLGDRAVGPLVANKLGRQVVQRLVDPLLGGIYAGSTADASAAAVFPTLLDASQHRASFMRALRAVAGAAVPGPPAAAGIAGGEPGSRGGAGGAGEPGGGDPDAVPPPAFWALRGGLASLTGRLHLLLDQRGVRVLTGHKVSALGRGPTGRWTVDTPGGPVAADAVVLALPAPEAADLLAPHDTDAAALLRAVEYASVAIVTLSFDAGAVRDDLFGTGLLVPQGTALPGPAAEQLGQGRRERETCMVTACTYLSAKWPHLAQPGALLLRASVGRFGDERFAQLSDGALVARVVAEVTALLGLEGEPSASLVTRWPHSLPQYRVHHPSRVAGVEAAVRRLQRLAVAGAAYHGVGIPACVASGRKAGRDVLGQLGIPAALPLGAPPADPAADVRTARRRGG